MSNIDSQEKFKTQDRLSFGQIRLRSGDGNVFHSNYFLICFWHEYKKVKYND